MSFSDIVAKLKGLLKDIESKPETPENIVAGDMVEEMIEMAENVKEAPIPTTTYEPRFDENGNITEAGAKAQGYEDIESYNIAEKMHEEDIEAGYANARDAMPVPSASTLTDGRPALDYSYEERLGIYKLDPHLYKAMFRK